MNSEHTDFGPYCLQYRLSKNISRRENLTAKVMTLGLRAIMSVSLSLVNYSIGDTAFGNQ